MRRATEWAELQPLQSTPTELEDFKASEAKFKYTHWLNIFVSIFFHVKHPHLKKRCILKFFDCHVLNYERCMLAAVSLVVVSLSVELTSPQTRAGDAHGRHPLASAA